jgi:hypothetical protein
MCSDDAGLLFVHGSSKPIRDRLGERVRLWAPYRGWDGVERLEGTIVELIGRNAFGVPLYGCHLDGYHSPAKPAEPITVDMAASEFAGEEAEAMREQMAKGIRWLDDALEG